MATDSKVSSLTASDALAGTELFYADGLASAAAADVKVTATQIKTWCLSLPLTLTQGTANSGIVVSTGGSNTGSNAASMVDMSWTLNTSGSPDVIAFRVTDTARGASTKLFNLYAGASGTTSEFNVDRSGLVLANSGYNSPGGARFGFTSSSDYGIDVNAGAGWVTMSPSATFGVAGIAWTSGTNPATAIKNTISRVSDGVIQIGTTTNNALGSINLTNLTATGTITVPGVTTAALTSTGTFTSGAGAQVGTLTNAPAAGNPTTWVKIVDNGTTRYIPAW